MGKEKSVEEMKALLEKAEKAIDWQAAYITQLEQELNQYKQSDSPNIQESKVQIILLYFFSRFIFLCSIALQTLTFYLKKTFLSISPFNYLN